MSLCGGEKKYPTPTFTLDPSLAPWNISVRQWLLENKKDHEFDGLATGNVVFNREGKALIVQRASHDSLPNRWEFPGGAADDEDPTILHAAARELREESGLIAKHFTHIVTAGSHNEPGEVFRNRDRTKVFVRFTYHVEVESYEEVKLDPNEHQDFLWATESEIREQKTGHRELNITKPAVQALFLEAFRLRRRRLETL